MVKQIIFCLGFCLVLSFGGVDPVVEIKAKDKELQALLKKKSTDSSHSQKEKIKELINGIFIFEELGRKSLGSKTYKELPEEKQKQFTTAFKEMVENSSLKRLEVYRSDSANYEATKFNSDSTKATVVAHSFLDNRESVLEYKLMLVDGKWKAWDLVIDDLSTYRQYKEQFSRILKKKTIDDLIKILEDKVKELSKDDKSDE